jgi:hypothetical protein
MRTGHALLLGLTILVAACASGTTSPSAPSTAASAASPASAARPSTAASTAVSSSPVIVTRATDLPAACVDAIRAYLMAVEPVVKDVQWRTMIETPPEVEDQLAEVAATVDPEVCPDLSAAEAHDAWIAIAFDAAPGTLDYIDFVYRP